MLDKRCSKRTLKKRIRKMMFLCTFVSILLFSSVMMFLGAEFFKSQAELISKYFSNSIASTMNSEYFLKQMSISDLKEFDSLSPESREWIQSLKTSQQDNTFFEMNPEMPIQKHFAEIKHEEHIIGNPFNLGLESMMNIKIEINNEVIFNSSNEDSKNLISQIDKAYDKGSIDYRSIDNLFGYFNATSKKDLYSADSSDIGDVTVKLSRGFFTILIAGVSIIILILTLAALIISSIISRILSYPIILPIIRLQQTMEAASYGSLETSINTQISVKKPLKEIQQLADSTNLILTKFQHYNEQLENQNGLLESQNDELEAQNEELAAKQEEIEAQNIELTEAKRQIEEAQTQLVQSENMAAVGQLTAAITHEINTPLGAISSNVQMSDMLLTSLEESEKLKEDSDLKAIIDSLREANNVSVMGCKRVTEIIKSLKTFSRIDQSDFQEADINDNIKSVLVLTSNLWKRKIEIHEDYTPNLLVKCYPGLLNQVFMNIMVNAIQSIDSTGDIYVKTSKDENGTYITIIDNGHGIKPENLSKIFDSGFTTKPAGNGMGLGLSICQNIIKKHNGEITVTSEAGKGTQFTVMLPTV